MIIPFPNDAIAQAERTGRALDEYADLVLGSAIFIVGSSLAIMCMGLSVILEYVKPPSKR